MAKEPTLRLLLTDPLSWQCTACGTKFDDFVATKLLGVVFLKHIQERHKSALEEDFSQAAARIVREATEGR